MIKNILVVLLLLFLLLPALQKITGLTTDYKLEGVNENTSKPQLTAKGFFEADFQEHVGYKGCLIALKNQLDHSLFHKLNYTIEEGDDGQLFYWNHIDTHCGHVTLSDDSVARKLNECVALKSLLDSLHIKMFFVLAPGKPYFYEDKLPARFKQCNTTGNDYQKILAGLRKKNIPVLDFNQWFRNLRTTSPYPLFPKLGTHWSFYGATLAVDSLAHYLQLPLLTQTDIAITDNARGKDKDLYDLLNVLLPMKSDSLAYPVYKLTSNRTSARKPKILLIGDSFNWTLLDTKMLPQLCSAESRFWFYKHQLYDLEGKWISDNPDEVDLYKLLKGTDAVIFLSTEALYHRFDHGFANSLLNNKAAVDSLIQNR